MGIREWFRSITNRTKQPDPNPISGVCDRQWWLGAAREVEGETLFSLTQQEAHSVVFACVSAISRSIGACPYQTVERDINGQRKATQDNIAYLMNTRPNPHTTAQTLRESLVVSALNYGNGYWEIQRDGSGKVVALWPLISDRMKLAYSTEQVLYYIYTQPDGSKVELDAMNVFHLRGISEDGLSGMGLLDKASKTINLALAVEQYASAYFANGTHIAGIISGAPANPNEAEQVYAAWNEQRKGTKRAGKIVYLPSAVKFESISSDAERAQLIQSRQFDVAAICRYFSVRPSEVGDPASSVGYGANQIQFSLDFVNKTLTPWVNSFCQEATWKLYGARSAREALLDTVWLTRGTQLQQAQALKVKRDAGIITVNEAREQLGLNPIEGGDELATKAPPQPQEQEPAVMNHAKRLTARIDDLLKAGKSDAEIESNLTQLNRKLIQEHKL